MPEVTHPESTSMRARCTIRRLWREVRHSPLEYSNATVDAAEQALLLGSLDEATREIGDLFALRAIVMAYQDDTLNALATAEQALRRGAKGLLGQLAALVLRYAEWKAGLSFDRAAAEARRARGSHRASRAALADVLDLTLSAAVAFGELDAAAAERLARDAVRRAGLSGTLTASPTSLLARILYERGRLAESEALLRARLPDICAVGGVDCISNAYGVLARIALQGGDRAGALASIDAGCRLAEIRDWPRLLAAMLAERVRLCEPSERRCAAVWLEQLRNLVARHRPRARCAHSEIACHLFRAELYHFWTFKSGVAPRGALACLRFAAWLSHDLQAMSWADLADAQLLWIEGDRRASVRCLEKVLRVALATGFRQTLLDAGPELPFILKHFQHDGAVEPALRELAEAIVSPPRSVVDSPTSTRRVSVGRGSLTPRERDVPKLIGEGRTNKGIALQQGVAPETIKTHVKNIFFKLGVERRAQAVAKADKLGLLPAATPESSRSSRDEASWARRPAREKASGQALAAAPRGRAESP